MGSERQIMNNSYLATTYLVVWMLIAVIPVSKLWPSAMSQLMQLLLFVNSVVVVYISQKVSRRGLIFVILLSHMFISLALRYYYMEFWNDPLGPIAIDSYNYNNDGIYYASYSFTHFINDFLEINGWDDLGFTFIIYSVYKLFSPGIGVHLLVVLNSIAIAISCNYLYRISCQFVSAKCSMFIIAIWGSLSFSMVTAANGLKENFFTSLIILAVYYLYKFIEKKSFMNFVLFLLISLTTSFFRMAMFPVLVMALVSIWIIKKIKPTVKSIILIASLIVLAICAGRYIMNVLLILRGFSDDTFSEMALNQYGEHNLGGPLSAVINVVFGFIGSTPSFISTPEKISYITLFNYSVFVILIFSSLYIYGIFKAFITQSNIIALVAITIINSVMIIAMSFSFDFRYRFVSVPFILIIAAFGMENSSPKLLKLHKLYCAALILLVLFYNINF